MEITEVRIFLREGADKKLKAYATITIDNAFVVRNVKVIEGNKGLFVAMPSRKLKGACPKCSFKNDAGSKFCNNCGQRFDPPLVVKETSSNGEKSDSEHRDIAHPITLECRANIQKKVLAAFESEKAKSATEVGKERQVANKAPAGASVEKPQKQEPANNTDMSASGDIEL